MPGMREICAQKSVTPGRVRGFATSDTDLFDAQFHAHAQHPQHLLIAQHFLLRSPGLLLLRHAITAAFVAPVGDGHAQIRDVMAEGVFHRGDKATRVGSVQDWTFHRPALEDKAGGGFFLPERKMRRLVVRLHGRLVQVLLAQGEEVGLLETGGSTSKRVQPGSFTDSAAL